MLKSTSQDFIDKLMLPIEEEIKQRAIRISNMSSEDLRAESQQVFSRVQSFCETCISPLEYPAQQEQMVQSLIRVLVKKYFVIFRFAHDLQLLQQQSVLIDSLREIPVLNSNIYFQE